MDIYKAFKGNAFGISHDAPTRSVTEVRAMHIRDTDAELVASFMKGDGESFAVLVDRYMSIVYRFIYRYADNSDAASDITQEVFIKVWKNIKKFDSQKNFKTWLLTIAKNTALDHVKKKKPIFFSRIEEGENDLDTFLAPYMEGDELPDQMIEKKYTKQRLDTMLGTLNPSYRNILLLRYTEHMKFREIADILEEPIDTVKSKHRRALILLRDRLADKDKDII